MNPLDNINSNEKIISLKAAAKHIPISGTFELLPLCNMNCKMCYIRMSVEEMNRKGSILSVEQWIKIAIEARDAGMLFLLITGGEPLLYQEFPILYREICQMGIVPILNTNGTLMNEEIADILAQNNPRKVNISLYGGSNETYNELCGNPQGFTQVMNAIHLLKERKIPVKLNCSLTPYNYKDLYKIKDIAGKLDLPVQFANYMFPPLTQHGNKSFQIQRLSAEQAAHIYVDTILYKKTKQQALEILSKELKRYEDFSENPTNLQKRGFTCYASKNNFWINWKGEMTACGMMSQLKYNVLEEGFVKAWEKLFEESQIISACEECINCKKRSHCQYCIASAYAETEDYSKRPEYLCELTDETLKCIKNTYFQLGGKDFKDLQI